MPNGISFFYAKAFFTPAERIQAGLSFYRNCSLQAKKQPTLLDESSQQHQNGHVAHAQLFGVLHTLKFPKKPRPKGTSYGYPLSRPRETSNTGGVSKHSLPLGLTRACLTYSFFAMAFDTYSHLTRVALMFDIRISTPILHTIAF